MVSRRRLSSGERRDVARIGPGMARPRPGGWRPARPELQQRLQAETDLEQDRRPEGGPEQGEGDGQRRREAPHVFVDLVRRPSDGDDEAAVLAEIDFALDDAEPAVVRAAFVAFANLAEAAVLLQRGQARNSASEQGLRRPDVARGAHRAGRPASTNRRAGCRTRGLPSDPSRAAPDRRALRDRRRDRWRRREGAGRRRVPWPRGRGPRGSRWRRGGSKKHQNSADAASRTAIDCRARTFRPPATSGPVPRLAAIATKVRVGFQVEAHRTSPRRFAPGSDQGSIR